MSFSQYADEQDFVVLGSDKVPVGAINLSEDIEIKHVLITFFKTGTLVGSEQIRLNLHSSERYDSPFARSEWASISDISNLAASWLGWLRLDFDRIDLDKDEVIYAEIETQNYTRVGDTFWMGIGLEGSPLINGITPADGAPAALQIFGYK